MKYKRGKSLKTRRQVKVFKLKQGGGKFTFSGGKKVSPFGNPVTIGFSAPDRVKENLKMMGFRTGRDKGGDK